MTDTGDEHIRNAGISLPCAKQFGWMGAGVWRCNRPYGHTGPHTGDGIALAGGRDAEDEARTMFVLTQILNGDRR